ncbi:hypothetical protein KEM54_004371 [Ascosphaera aggregata]|nr:hypothetical protein KEM54_004371 [Ascosphaera aggregata]
MQYVRSLSGSVSKTWNSINPATLSGAIDVIVIEQEDGTIVEFRVNGVKQNYPMKLGEGGEAFFVFQTTDDIPLSMQTSPVLSPTSSPGSDFVRRDTDRDTDPPLQEPEFLDLDKVDAQRPTSSGSRTSTDKDAMSASADNHSFSYDSTTTYHETTQVLDRSKSAEMLKTPISGRPHRSATDNGEPPVILSSSSFTRETTSIPRSISPPPLPPKEAFSRAIALSKKLSVSNIPSQVTDSGDLMLDMTGYKSNEDDALRAEATARKILAEELEGNYDIGALMDADEQGNIWIFGSEESKEAATQRGSLTTARIEDDDAISDPGYHSDASRGSITSGLAQRYGNHAQAPTVVTTGRSSEGLGDPNTNYAKTLRLTSDQLRALDLKPGANEMRFSVNKATCVAFMYLWSYKTPIVISDIDGTITKSDALGHVLNMIGRDWTHLGVAKLYTDIVNNGYNIMYLTSRSTGQADTTRAYLNGVLQEGYRLPRGPVIMSPDRTIAALRREIYLRKPEVFKMACLRDILNLFQRRENPFYAGFGNRLTDALSYRSVNIPSSRIFTINSNAEVYMDLLSLNKYKSSYVSMRELVDHFFPPVGTLVQEGGEDFTDFNYWRDKPLDLEYFSSTDSESDSSSVTEHDDVEFDEENDLDADMHEEYSDEDDEEEDEDDGFIANGHSLNNLHIRDSGHGSSSSLSGEEDDYDDGDDEKEDEQRVSAERGRDNAVPGNRQSGSTQAAYSSERRNSPERDSCLTDPLDQSG